MAVRTAIPAKLITARCSEDVEIDHSEPGHFSGDDESDTGLVLRKIISIIGIYPSRNELVELSRVLEWGTFERSESKIKPELIQRLESRRDTILPFLDSVPGELALKHAYLAL